ncbi:hypothetical protein [Psychromicrobium xiongbiense]|uniref:hypothetical protein n=1 Tax=Psychromicrobium xiongbiense TaxID=3051184 RepID=UPI00255767D9|nr:hypothetical protein [Psychromicrobium sp. YIM S02556]
MITKRTHGRVSILSLTLGLTAWFTALSGLLMRRIDSGEDRERGDVPGWVMVTLMTAILVAGLLVVAGPALEKMFVDAMARIK